MQYTTGTSRTRPTITGRVRAAHPASRATKTLVALHDSQLPGGCGSGPGGGRHRRMAGEQPVYIPGGRIGRAPSGFFKRARPSRRASRPIPSPGGRRPARQSEFPVRELLDVVGTAGFRPGVKAHREQLSWSRAAGARHSPGARFSTFLWALLFVFRRQARPRHPRQLVRPPRRQLVIFSGIVSYSINRRARFPPRSCKCSPPRYAVSPALLASRRRARCSVRRMSCRPTRLEPGFLLCSAAGGAGAPAASSGEGGAAHPGRRRRAPSSPPRPRMLTAAGAGCRAPGRHQRPRPAAGALRRVSARRSAVPRADSTEARLARSSMLLGLPDIVFAMVTEREISEIVEGEQADRLVSTSPAFSSVRIDRHPACNSSASASVLGSVIALGTASFLDAAARPGSSWCSSASSSAPSSRGPPPRRRHEAAAGAVLGVVAVQTGQARAEPEDGRQQQHQQRSASAGRTGRSPDVGRHARSRKPFARCLPGACSTDWSRARDAGVRDRRAVRDTRLSPVLAL